MLNVDQHIAGHCGLQGKCLLCVPAFDSQSTNALTYCFLALCPEFGAPRICLVGSLWRATSTLCANGKASLTSITYSEYTGACTTDCVSI